jgi:16S rRNA (cytidine1402-2'-O)-methyltransferase
MTGHSGHAQFTVEGHVFSARPLAEGLHLVATPLGNLGDISFRALSTLAAADTILCEDTRVTSRLLQRFAIATRMRPYHDHNAARVRPAILEELRNGVRIALVSDAGMPAVSDPGYKLVRACIDDGLPVDVIPGPTAPVTALALSGLPTDRFLFAGFLPAKAGQRRSQLTELAAVPATIILFESATRLAACLADIADIMGIAVRLPLPVNLPSCTRKQCAVRQQLIEEIEARGGVKGEITLVIAPPGSAEPESAADVAGRLRELLETHPASKAAASFGTRNGPCPGPNSMTLPCSSRIRTRDHRAHHAAPAG